MEVISNWAETFSTYTGLQPWTFAVFSVVLVALLVDFLQRRLMRRLGKLVKQSTNTWDDAMFNAAVWPISFVIWLVGITTAAGLIPAFDVTGEFGDGLVIKIRQVGIVFSLAWFLVTFIKNIENNISEESRKGKRKIDETTVRALGRVVHPEAPRILRSM